MKTTDTTSHSQHKYTQTKIWLVSTFLDAAFADNLGGPPTLIFGPGGFAPVAAGTEAAAAWLAAADDGLPTTTAFSQHSFIYNTNI